MKCAQCQLLIDDIGDMDRLPSDAARHVATCPACERFGVDLISLRRLLREPARVTAPDSFDIALARRLRAARTAPPSRLAILWALRPQTSLAAAAAFLLVCSGALIVSRYAVSPDTASGPGLVVASNRPVSPEVVRPGEATISTPVVEPGMVAGLESVSSTSNGDLRANRAVVRTRTAGRRVDSTDAMLLVSDERGSRLVNVPGVLIGSEMIVPVASGDGGDSPETVSF